MIRSHRNLAAISVAALLAAAFASGVQAETRLIPATTTLDTLTIPAGRTLAAPDGKSLTLTVNGVDTTIAPGTYTGQVVLTVTDPIIVQYKKLEPHHYRTAVYINDGKYVPTQSVAAAVSHGQVDDQAASHIAVTSREESFNGIVVTGDSKYTIESPVIDMVGNGGNDFAGFGAAIMSSGNADVTVNNAKIHTKGSVRTAIFVGGHSVMHVNNADIYTENGQLPADYKFTLEVGKMMEVPWMLGLSGNVRATNLVDHGTVYYTNSHIRSQGCGAMSTDDAAVVRMYVKDSLIETIDSGYGAYSIGDSVDTFDHSTLNVADVALIMAAQGNGVFTNGTVVNSRRYGVLMHSGMGGGNLTIEKGSVFNTRSTAIEAKGRGTNVLIDNAQIYAGNGILLQAMINDDPFANGPPPGAAPGAIIGVQGGDPSAPAMPPEMANMPKESPDVFAIIRNTSLEGDILNTRTIQGGLHVSLEKAQLVGAISTGTQAPVSGEAPIQLTYWQIGNVVNTLGATKDANGAAVKVGPGSVWTVTKTSYITKLEIAGGSKVRAPQGYRLALTVNGKATPVTAGHYSGKIVLKVTTLK